jgi:hypothetical protein
VPTFEVIGKNLDQADDSGVVVYDAAGRELGAVAWKRPSKAKKDSFESKLAEVVKRSKSTAPPLGNQPQDGGPHVSKEGDRIRLKWGCTTHEWTDEDMRAAIANVVLIAEKHPGWTMSDKDSNGIRYGVYIADGRLNVPGHGSTDWAILKASLQSHLRVFE